MNRELNPDEIRQVLEHFAERTLVGYWRIGGIIERALLGLDADAPLRRRVAHGRGQYGKKILETYSKAMKGKVSPARLEHFLRLCRTWTLEDVTRADKAGVKWRHIWPLVSVDRRVLRIAERASEGDGAAKRSAQARVKTLQALRNKLFDDLCAKPQGKRPTSDLIRRKVSEALWSNTTAQGSVPKKGFFQGNAAGC